MLVNITKLNHVNTNEPHVTLSPESAEWAIQEILKGEKNCPAICSFQLSGAERVCSGQNETYTLNVAPPSGVSTNWSVSGTLSIESQTNNSVTVRSTGYHTNSKIMADFENPCGANPRQIVKTVISGTGNMGIVFETHAICYYQAEATIVNSDYTYEWSLNNIHFTNTLPPLEHTYAPNGGFVAGNPQHVYLKWTSSCGQETEHVMFTLSHPPPGCSPRPEGEQIEDEPLEGVLVFPNPAEDWVMIRGDIGHTYSYAIYNMLGSRLMADVFSHSVVINTQILPSGVYMVKVLDEMSNTVEQAKLVIE